MMSKDVAVTQLRGAGPHQASADITATPALSSAAAGLVSVDGVREPDVDDVRAEGAVQGAVGGARADTRLGNAVVVGDVCAEEAVKAGVGEAGGGDASIALPRGLSGNGPTAAVIDVVAGGAELQMRLEAQDEPLALVHWHAPWSHASAAALAAVHQLAERHIGAVAVYRVDVGARRNLVCTSRVVPLGWCVLLE